MAARKRPGGKKPLKIAKRKVRQNSSLGLRPGVIPPTRRKDAEYNDVLIRNSYLKLVGRLKRCPKREEIAEDTGISKRTLIKHFKIMTFEPMNSPLRVLTPDVLQAIAKSALDGKSASQRLYFQLVEGWIPREALTGPNGETLQFAQVHFYFPDNGRNKNRPAAGSAGEVPPKPG